MRRVCLCNEREAALAAWMKGFGMFEKKKKKIKGERKRERERVRKYVREMQGLVTCPFLCPALIVKLLRRSRIKVTCTTSE